MFCIYQAGALNIENRTKVKWQSKRDEKDDSFFFVEKKMHTQTIHIFQ